MFLECIYRALKINAIMKKVFLTLFEFIRYSFGAYIGMSDAQLLLKNAELANSSNGEVYILFTGGSLRNKDLGWLNGKDLIATNLFCISEQYSRLDIKHYSIIEPWSYKNRIFLGFFLDLIGLRRKVGTRPVVWLNSSANYYIKNKSLHNDYNTDQILSGMDIRYIHNTADFTLNNEINMDLSKPCNTAAGTITFNIFLAMYLGYRKIFLLGADYSKSPMEAGHFYENWTHAMSPDEANAIAGFDLDSLVKKRAMLMKEHARRLGVEIVNVVDDGYQSQVFDEMNYLELSQSL